MNAIRTVNMIWENRYRGAYPVSRYALDDDGTLTLALPRPLEVRAHDVTRIRPDGGSEIVSGFSVETLSKLEVPASGRESLGMTADDVYLFHADTKRRFLGDKHIIYSDSALSADGQTLIVAYSDMAAVSFALGMGDISGRVIWTTDVDAVITAIAIARDGGRLAYGMENGQTMLLDSSRREVWRFAHDESVRALACSQDGAFTVFGTAGGSVGLIDVDGVRRWQTRVEGEVFVLALSGDGKVCAALAKDPEQPGVTQVFCLTAEGQVGWQYPVEKRLLGIALSPGGEYMATGARDGTHAVYGIVSGAGQSASSAIDSGAAQKVALEQARSGDVAGAYCTLRASLEANAADHALCEAAVKARDVWLNAALEQARKAALSDPDSAVTALMDFLKVEPHEPAVVALLLETRKARAAKLFAEATAKVAVGESDSADALLLKAIADDPLRPDIRQALAALRRKKAEAALAEADRLLAAGSKEEGIAALERVQALLPTPEMARRLAEARTAHEFDAGLAFYNERRYQEAIFQFRKVLARDAAHADAKRYLAYAERFAQDTSTSDLSDRFSRLE